MRTSMRQTQKPHIGFGNLRAGGNCASLNRIQDNDKPQHYLKSRVKMAAE